MIRVHARNAQRDWEDLCARRTRRAGKDSSAPEVIQAATWSRSIVALGSASTAMMLLAIAMTVVDAQLRHHNQGSCHGITCVGQGGRPNTSHQPQERNYRILTRHGVLHTYMTPPSGTNTRFNPCPPMTATTGPSREVVPTSLPVRTATVASGHRLVVAAPRAGRQRHDGRHLQRRVSSVERERLR